MAEQNTFLSKFKRKDRKKFKDTKVGIFLKEKAPDIIETVGDLLPDAGVLGIAKNLIKMSDKLTPEEKDILTEDIAQMYEVEVRDRESARLREVETLKAGKHDFLFTLTGLIGLSVFCFIVYAIAFLQIPEANKEIWIHLIGISEGVVLSIFGYYFGSAMKKNVN
tara:strand:- start:2954 stop:3448 length:495 start_codon:yes stop_codon:yes gene_type:complete